jgi:D-glycero-D-manno-heptose 1,7-bisphosphate phosphatase
MSGRAAIFIDRDGVLNQLVVDRTSGYAESPYAASDVRLAPCAVRGMRSLAQLHWPLVVVSNQPAAAKGTATREALGEVHDEVDRQLRAAGVHVDAYHYCFHHPDGIDPALAEICACRKPGWGLILDAARELEIDDLAGSWMIGDSDVDVLAGRGAGCRTILIEEPASAHRRGGAEPDFRADDLQEAATVVLESVAARGVLA